MALKAELGRPVKDGPAEQQIKQEAELFGSMPSPPLSNASYSADHRDSVSPAPSSPAADTQDFAASLDLTQHPAAML